MNMVRGNKRYVRDAEVKESKLKKTRTIAQIEAVTAGINVALEKIRVLRDTAGNQTREQCNDVICDLKCARDSLRRTVDDLEQKARPETDDESDHRAADAAPNLVKREPEDGAAGN